jgi:hypothetical protein
MKSDKGPELKMYRFSVAVDPKLSALHDINSQYFKLFLRKAKK